MDAGVLGVVELKLTEKNKKIAAAAYEYKAVHPYVNDDDEWGEIRFDFVAGTAQIVKPADGDMSKKSVRKNRNPSNLETLHERTSEEIDVSL